MIVLFAIVLGGGLAIGSLFYSDKIALSTARAVVVSPTTQQAAVPARHRGPGVRAGRHAQAAGRHRHTRLPNAFATGRNADKSVLCVTTGLMSMLTPEELEGVIAHEMSHVAHKDVQVMTIASFLAIIAGLLIRFSFYGELFGGGAAGAATTKTAAPCPSSSSSWA